MVQLFFDNGGTILALMSTTYAVVFAPATDAQAAEANDIIYQRIIPGLGVSVLIGGLFYAIQGAMLSAKEERLATALPYGINTPGSFAVLFGIIGPVFWANSAGCSDDACVINAMEEAWRAGITTNFLVGVISVVLGFFGPAVRKFTPPVALLTALAGIGMAFLTIGQLTNIYAEPIAGIIPLFMVFILYFGDVSIGAFPKSLAIIIVGTILGWADSVHSGADIRDAADNLKWWGIQTGFSALGDWSSVGDSIGTVFPVAFAAAAGTLMNVYSAEQAGDSYGVTLTMVSDGIGTIIAALFGCPFSTSVYIGHPAYKRMNAGTMYSVFNGVVLFFFSLCGMFAMISAIVPMPAVSPILVFVGLTITAEAIVAARPHEYPAFALGIIPSIVDWANQGGAYTPGTGVGGDNPSSYYGYVAMCDGPLLVALVTCAIATYTCNRQFVYAAAWSLATTILAAFGFIHQPSVRVKNYSEPGSEYCYSESVVMDVERFESFSDCATAYFPTLPWRFLVSYLMLTIVFLGLVFLQRAGKVAESIPMDEDDVPKRVAENEPEHLAA